MRRIVFGIVLLLALAGLTAAPAQAAGGHVLVPYAGTAHKLVYGEFPTPTHKTPKPVGALYWRTAHGKAHKIGAARFGYPVYLAWPMVIYRSATGFKWHDLKTGDHGAAPQEISFGGPDAGYTNVAELIGATPTGWLLDEHPAETDPATLPDRLFTQDVHDRSVVTPLGSPFTQPGLLQVATTGKTAVFTNYGLDDRDYTGFEDGGALAMDFSTPGTFRRILPTKVGQDTFCPSVTSSYVACYGYPSGSPRTAQLLTLDGTGIAQSTPHHCVGEQPAVLGDKLAWVASQGAGCKPHRLSIITRSGAHKIATGTYDDDPVAALGGVVVGAHAGGKLTFQTYTDKQLVLVTSARKHRVLVTAH